MIAEQILALLDALHVKKAKIKGNGWVEGCCPLARWTHKNGTDSTPSFGVSINPAGPSHYSCFACQHGSIEELVQVLELYSKDTPGGYDFALCHQLQCL